MSDTTPSEANHDLPGELPDYADALLAYHRSHAETLNAMVSRLPLTMGQTILDVATGDGTYAILMAQRGANVVVLDQDPDYLSLASSRATRRGLHVTAASGDACNLPFEENHFDGVFCAQSFYSISNVSRVLQEMRRVVKPGGWVGVLENDSLHHVVLPWPADLELAIRLGQYRALVGASPGQSRNRASRKNKLPDRDSPAKTKSLQTEIAEGERYYIGRRLFSVLLEAGFEEVREASFATTHTAPLRDDAHTFLREHALEILDQAHPHLTPEVVRAAQASCDPTSSDYLFTRPDFSATVLDLLVWGTKPLR
jgi:SAM-dependent methyltransferase